MEDGFVGGHYFQHIHDSSAAAQTPAVGNMQTVKAIMSDYKRTRKMLPEPDVNGAIFIRFDSSRPSYCRALIIGPADTP